MPPPASAPKWEFLMHLGLNKDNSTHQHLYTMMKNEAITVYDSQLSSNRSALRPQHASASKPWSANMFTDAAFSHAIQTVFDNASSQTRAFYARGQGSGENWVIRWMLYHICRYRDSRNKKSRGKNFHDDDDLDGPPGSSKSGGGSGSKGKTPFYDPIRNKETVA